MQALDGISRPSLDGFRKASSGALDKAKLMVGLKTQAEIDEEQQRAETESQSQTSERSGILTDVGDLLCPDLTFQQRLIGFVSCFGIGYLITFMSFKFFIELIEGYPVPFALNYTFGHLLSLGASWFLCGPKRQFRNMFDEKRKWTSIIYLSCLVITLALVFIPLPWQLRLFLLLISIMTQFFASCWYSLSYIPYGRKTAINMAKRSFGLNESPIPLVEG